MLFNSFEFALFLPLVFLGYWLVFNKSIKSQNVFLLISSYIFYGWWDYRFLALISFSSFVDYKIGLLLNKKNSVKKRKVLLFTSLFVNIAFLGFFKYYNFFIESFSDVFTLFGKTLDIKRLSIILPVGISFYTFQTLSYTIDIYRKKIKPTRNPIVFFTFVSFFPQLVAGPIERASTLIPQFSKKRTFDYQKAVNGFHQILWGLFKKIVIADNCAQYTNEIFTNYNQYSSLTLILGVVYFSFQIYADFSGYSDIALGTSKLFGFKLMTNFNYPYFSKNIAEFWRRWHISLTTWFKDYLYIPIGGNKGGYLLHIRNTLIIFLVSGFWHGANWTFIFWGLLNAILYLIYFYTKNDDESKPLNSLITFFKILKTYILISFTWIFFRANSINEAFNYIQHLFTSPLIIERLNIERFSFEILPLIFLLIIIEWKSRFNEHPITSKNINYKYSLLLVLMILLFGSFSTIQNFIYFQF